MDAILAGRYILSPFFLMLGCVGESHAVRSSHSAWRSLGVEHVARVSCSATSLPVRAGKLRAKCTCSMRAVIDDHHNSQFACVSARRRHVSD